MEKIRVGILRGGVGDYYETSLREGGDIIAVILENLSDKYKPIDILIDKDGAWHAGGVPVRPTDLMDKVDIIWNASHPNFSQALKDSIPFVGTNPFSRNLEDSRAMLESHMKAIGIKMPQHIILPLYQKDFDGPKEKYAAKKAKEIFEKFSSPWIVKSFTSPSDMGIHVAKTFPELVDSIEDGVSHQKSILVEELLPGKSASMHSVAGFRGEDIYTFPPGNFSKDEKEKLIASTEKLYNHVDATHYLKSDFILSPSRGIFLTNITLSPDFRADSDFCQSCESVGAKAHHVLEHMLESGLVASR